MKMPIVSLNNMAMNESVAATCCFAATDINGHAYETVLSGGYLTDKIGNKVILKDIVDGSWIGWRGDYQAALNGLPLTYEYVNSTLGWQYGVNTGTEFVLLKDLKWAEGTNGNYALYELNLTNCDHNGMYCSYVANVETTFTKTHVGSTVEHAAGGKTWADNHAAVRFNS